MSSNGDVQARAATSGFAAPCLAPSCTPSALVYARDPRLALRRLAAYVSKLASQVHMAQHARDIPGRSTLSLRANETWRLCEQAPCSTTRAILRDIGWNEQHERPPELGTRRERAERRRAARVARRENAAGSDRP